jgi:Zn-dependent protease/CBS domain-containing protein
LGSLKVGRIAGIDILVHWSWFAIFGLLVYWLGEGFFGEVDAYDHWSETERWAAASLTSGLFFLSVLLHEISHSLVAKRLGLTVANITLFIFGGVSSLTSEPESPKDEFKIAIVGPLTSFVLGILAAIVAGALFAAGKEDTMPGAIAEYLAIVNIAVGIFNMLPGYPLDGGRVLRSALWARSNNLLKATKWASNVGVVIAYAMMGGGVLMVLAGNFISGVWFGVIGLFLRNSSEQAYQQLLYRNTLEGATVGQMVNRNLESAPPDASLADLVNDYMVGKSQRCVPIVVAGDLLGVVTMSDLQSVPREEWATTSAFRAMTPRERLHTVVPEDDLTRALELMAQYEVHQLPVVDGQRNFLGFVTRADVLRLIQIRQEVGSRAA